ncbi:PIG-L family deacetylase [Ectopseudomonas toyotomiensis]|uniref:PIG-L family deacetylase n=1 Tax=Ectopseudomonas toyotomiensis TaxID=554344 RepID=A0ABD7DR14_9GAMM|nr:PIG-L family deacetylase [Pseudomonas toyotomiensis]QSL90851.1 PIG-L family deacetylase [Pseudomonas toyotomiensis]
METRKQGLLRRHRRNKRITMAVALPIMVALDWFAGWSSLPVLLLLAWIAHEAWFSDHLFYSPRDDYQYSFPASSQVATGTLSKGRIALDTVDLTNAMDTLILEVSIHSSWLGRWLDPHILICAEAILDRQDFEQGARGRRYLNISGLLPELQSGKLRLRTRFCRLSTDVRLYAFSNPDYAMRRVMVIAPHADDAELAAFGLYSRSDEACIVTLTQGEIEAHNYARMGLDRAAAARLKGRLRSWSSLAVPLWGGVPASRCVQLGYYCLQLTPMASAPEQAFPSLESGESDMRSVRRFNPIILPGDVDGVPSWRNLVGDLAALLVAFRPEVVVLPHPELDPHPDHIQASKLLDEAVALSEWSPEVRLLYANHLYDNDRWPMGPVGNGISLPPCHTGLSIDGLWSPLLNDSVRMDKAQALAMQHDLQTPLPLKKRLRRLIQWLLAGRRWPEVGQDDFFRKAVRRHELFWVRALPDRDARVD